MSYSPGPGSRVPVPRSRLRFDRRRAARRRGFAVFLGVVAVVIGALAWASTGGEEERADGEGGTSPVTGSTTGPTGPDGGNGASGPTGSVIVPGQTPIEHVVF